MKEGKARQGNVGVQHCHVPYDRTKDSGPNGKGQNGLLAKWVAPQIEQKPSLLLKIGLE